MNNVKTKKQDATLKPLLARRWAEVVCLLALTFLAANSLLVIREKCVTTDEAFMIPAGYYHLAARDMRPVNEHPPLIKTISAAPLLLLNPAVPPHEGVELRYYTDAKNLYWNFWRANAARIDELSFWSRVPVILLTVILGALLFVYARKYFGTRAAAFAVLLFALEPTVLAHSRVVQTDIPASLGLLLFVFAFYEYLTRPSINRAAWLGFVAGLAVVMKFSLVVLAPLLVLTALVILWRAPRRGLERKWVAAQACVVALAALLTIDAAYLFQFRPPNPGEVETVLNYVFPDAGQASLRGWLAHIYSGVVRLVPADFLEGVGWQLQHARDGHEAAIMGRYSSHGWWWYFPAAFALKTTLPFLLLSLASLVWVARDYWKTRERRFLLILVPFAAYTALVMSSSINIGVRYYLPAYMFLFIAAGTFLDRLLRREHLKLRVRRAALALVVVAFAWIGFEAGRGFPDYMTYTNQLAWSQPHWWYLSDSNVEWGDDVRALALYLRERGETEVRASLLNYNMLEPYGIGYRWAYAGPEAIPTDTRYVAIGASYLNGSVNPGGLDERILSTEERVNLFAQYRRMKPEKVFGGSIYLYRVRE